MNVTLWFTIQCYFAYLLAQIVPALGSESFIIWLLCPFDIPDWAASKHKTKIKSSSGF